MSKKTDLYIANNYDTSKGAGPAGISIMRQGKTLATAAPDKETREAWAEIVRRHNAYEELVATIAEQEKSVEILTDTKFDSPGLYKKTKALESTMKGTK